MEPLNHYYLGLLCLGSGLFGMAGSYFNWDWFFTLAQSGKSQFVLHSLGRQKARYVFGGLGLFLFLSGLFLLTTS